MKKEEEHTMFIKQISIFLENVPGALREMTHLLGEGGVDLLALSIADTANFGIVRVIVADHQIDPALALLRAGELAKQFDAAPGYHLRTVRFTAPAERASAYDDNGAMAEEGIRNILRAFDDAALNALWKDLNDHE